MKGLALGFPRTRGDRPVGKFLLNNALCMASSNVGVQEMPQAPGSYATDQHGSPAHAGIDPSAVASMCLTLEFPRTRGD